MFRRQLNLGATPQKVMSPGVPGGMRAEQFDRHIKSSSEINFLFAPVIFIRVKELIAQYNYDDELKLLEDNDNEPASERPEDAEQGVQSIVEIEVEGEDNNKEKYSNSDEDTFGAYFSNRNDPQENDENDKNISEDLDDQPKQKKLKRIRISSKEEEDN